MIYQLNLNIATNVTKLKNYLASHRLNYDADTQICFIYEIDGDIVACACRTNYVFKQFAVNKELQHQNLLGQLISKLIENSYENEIYNYFVFTKAKYQTQFNELGFNVLTAYDDYILLEKGNDSFMKFIDRAKDLIDSNKEYSAIVMNLNPMTNGHLYLIEQAYKQNPDLIVFLVEENSSQFSTQQRYDMLVNNTKHLSKLVIIKSGRYIISQATFPSYFLKKTDDLNAIYTYLDLSLFVKIMQQLNITRRFVGTEPMDVVTSLYNKSMSDVLKDKLMILDRISFDGQVISASLVRNYLLTKQFAKIKPIVPEYTYKLLTEIEAKTEY